MSRYAVIGTGALGGFYGSLLAQAGHEVHFLARSDAEYIREHGLNVESKLGDFQITQVNAHASTASMPICKFVIVAIKSTENHHLRELLPPVIDDDSIVIVLQNGLHVEQMTEDVVGRGRVVGGCCFLCSNKVGPGHIRHLDYGTVLLGAYRGQDKNSPAVDDETIQRIVDDFRISRIEISSTDDLETARWKKLMWNIPFNGLSVVLDASTDRIMTTPSSRELAISLMREARQAAIATSCHIDESHIDMLIEHTDNMVPYDSSMRLDFKARKPMELQAIFGNPLIAAKKVGFEAPRIEMLYRQLCYLQATALHRKKWIESLLD